MLVYMVGLVLVWDCRGCFVVWMKNGNGLVFVSMGCDVYMVL